MGHQDRKPDHEQMSRLIFQEEFRSEEDCIEWLFKTRWPNGFQCPRCGQGERYWKISTRGLYKCASCKHQVSLTAGTVFHKTRTELLKWFMLIFRMATSKTGVSINEMKRELEINDYKTVWVMAHKVRKAMADRDAALSWQALLKLTNPSLGHHLRANGAVGRRQRNS